MESTGVFLQGPIHNAGCDGRTAEQWKSEGFMIATLMYYWLIFAKKRTLTDHIILNIFVKYVT